MDIFGASILKKEDLNKLNANMAAQGEHVQSLSADNERLKLDILAVNERASDLTDKIGELNDAVADLSEACENKENEIRLQAALIEEKDAELVRYEKALSDAQKAIELAIEYEAFYGSTIEDADATIDAINLVLNRRELLLDDPDVQNTMKLFGVFRDIVVGYVNARQEKIGKEGSSGEKAGH